MTPDEKLKIKRVFNKIRALNESKARCTCLKFYRLVFDADLTKEIDVAEAIIDHVPVSWLEAD